MDLKSLKRKELQALCKKHGFPANSTSAQMIESLSSILENHDKVKPKGCLKGSGGSGAEDLGFVGGNLKKKVSFVVEDKGEEEFDEIKINPAGNSRTKSDVSDIVGVERRSTRSRGLAEAVMWSPVIEKKKKSFRVGTEGVRQNDKPISSEVSTTRSLRNRVVVVGGDEGLAADQDSRRTRKRKISDRKEENETVASKLEEDGFVGRKNLGKRSRGGDIVGDEAPNRRSSPNPSKLGENVAIEEVDVGRSKKRRKRDADSLVLDKGVDEDIEMANRTKGMIVNSTAMESGDAKNAEGRKKAQGQGKTRASKRGHPTTSTLDSEVVILPARRSTRSSSLVEKSDEVVEAVEKGKLQKRVKEGGSSDFVSEPARRSTRSSSTLQEDGTPLPVAGLPVEGAVEVSTGKSEKRAKCHGSEGGEVIAEPVGRSAHSSSIVVKSDEEQRAIKKGGSQKEGLRDSEVVAEPIRRTTRTSTLREDGASLLVGKPVGVGEVVKKSKSQKQAKGHGTKGTGSTTSLRDSETITELVRRSTRGASSLLENDTSPVVEAAKEVKSHNQGKGRTLKGRAAPLSDNEDTPMRRSTRGSSKSLEDEARLSEVEKLSGGEVAIKNKKPGKQHRDRASKLGDSTALLPENDAVTEPEMGSTRGSSKLLNDETLLPIAKDNTGKGAGNHASKKEDHATAISTRRSTRGSSKLEDGLLPDETSGGGNEVRKNKSGKKSKNHDLTASVPVNEPVTTPPRLSIRSSSKPVEDMNFLDAVSKDKPGKKSRSYASKEGDSRELVSDNPVVSESVGKSTRSSLKHVSLEVETSLPVCAKLDDEVRSMTMENSVPSNVVERVTSKGDHAAPAESCSGFKNEILSSMGDNSGDEAEKVGRKKTRKEQREDELEGQTPEVFVSNYKLVAQTKAMEEHEQSKELPSRSVRSTSKKNVLGGDKVEASKSNGGTSVSAPPIAGISFDLSFGVESGNPETGFNDVDDKNAPEMRQALAKVEEATSLVGSAKDLDDVCLDSEINGNQSSVFELVSEASGAVQVNIEGSSEIEEKVSGQLRCSNLFPIEPSTIEVNSELTSVSAPAHLNISKELSATFDTEISTTAHPKEPDSVVEVSVEHEDIITGCEAMHASSSQFPKSSEKLSLRTDSHTSLRIDLEEPRLTAEIRGASEDVLEDDVETNIVVPTLVCKSSEEPTLTLTAVNESDTEIDLKEIDSKVEDDGPIVDVVEGNEAISIIDPKTSDTEVCVDSYTFRGVDLEEPKVEICGANEDGHENELPATFNTEISTMAHPKEPDSVVEVGVEHEDIITGYETMHVSSSQFPKSSEELTPGTDSHTSLRIDREEPRLIAEIGGASEDVLEDDEGTNIVVPTLVCKSSEELTLAAVNESDTEIDLKETDSKVEDDGPSEDVVADEAMNIIDPMTSDTEVCADSYTFQGVDLEEPKVEICGANEDDLVDYEETDIVAQTSVCENSELLPTSVTVANPEIDLKEPNSKVEDDSPSEDVVADDEATNIFDPMTSDTKICADYCTSRGIDLEEPRLKAEIYGVIEDGLEDEETDIEVQTSVCKSSEEPTLTSVTVANPEIDAQKSDSMVEVDGSSEDIVGEVEAKMIFDPMTSDAEVCAEPLCNIKVEESDSKMEVHDATKGDMEQNEATTTVSSVMSCRSTGILSPTSLNEASSDFDLGQVDTPAMNKEASHSEGFLIEASGKTLEVSMAVDKNPGDTSSTRRIFDVEMANWEANPDIILKSHLEHRECDIVNKIEAVACDKHPQLYEDLEVIKETWLSSTLSVAVNDGIEIEDDRKDAEKNENEPRSSSPGESHAVEGTQSSPEDIVDAKQSDFSQSFYDNEPADAEKKLRVSSDDKFCAENNDSLISPVGSMKYKGTSYAAPLEHKDEPSAIEIAEVSTEITEGKSSVDHRSSTGLLDATSKSEMQMEKDYKLCDADIGSKGYSATSNENISLTDAVLFGDVRKVVEPGHLPTLPVTFTSSEEILPISVTEAPTLLGNEGSTMQVDVHDFSDIQDNEDGRNLSGCQEVTVNVMENLGVDFVDVSSKLALKEQVDVEQLNTNSDALPETSISVKKITDVEFERTIVLVTEAMDNIGSLESEANAEGDGTKEDNIEPDKFHHLDEDNEDGMKLSGCQEVTVNVMENLGVDFMDTTSKLALKEHVDVEQLNANSDALPESSISVNKLTDAAFEKTFVLVSEEMDNNGSLEREVNAEGYEGAKADIIEPDKFDHLDEGGQKPDEAFLLQEIKCSTGELHTEENASRASLNNSDNEDGRNFSDCQEVAVNVMENFGVDFMDMSSKLALKEHVDVEQLNVNSDALPETSISVNKLTDVEFERTIALVSEEMDNIGSLEGEVNAEGYDGTKADDIEPDKFDHLDEGSEERDEAFALQEIKCFTGELHTDENASYASLNNPASGSAEERVLLLEKISPSTCMANAPSLPKMDVLLPRSEQLDEDCNEKASAKDGTPNSEEFLSAINFIPSANKQECQDNNINMSFSGMDQYFGVVDEQSNKFQGTFESFFSDTFESFDQASNAGACEEHCETPAEKLFPLNNEAAASMNDNAEVGECEHREENLGHDRCEEFSENDSMKTLAIREDEMKGVASGSSVAAIEESGPYECEMSSEAENLSGASAKTLVDVDSQATYSARQSEDLGDGRLLLQQTPGVPIILKDGKFAVPEESKLDQAVTPIPIVGRSSSEIDTSKEQNKQHRPDQSEDSSECVQNEFSN